MTKDQQECFLGRFLKYKGIENFCRRVAFNLGNTPSKTEVKIVSCIPIDVTDLQERIASLEKQLDEKQNQPVENCSTLNETEYTQGYDCDVDKLASSCGICSTQTDICVYDSDSQIATFTYDMELTSPEGSDCKVCSKPEIYTVQCMKNESQQKLPEANKEWFRNQKKIKNEPLIYYAKTKTCSSFPQYMRQSVDRSHQKRKPSKIYLAKVMSKQYKPKVLLFDRRSSGALSAPVCCDPRESLTTLTSYESDLSSCCHSNFQNIDKYIARTNYDSILEQPSTSREECYYDAKLYDVVPVREKTNSVNTEIEENMQPEINMDNVLEKMELLCKPSKVRYKTRPITVNYHTVKPARQHWAQQLNRKDKNIAMNDNHKKEKNTNTPSTDTRCSIECGSVYAKNTIPNGIKLYKRPKGSKNFALSTLHENKQLEPISKTSDDQKPPVKTEDTLQQIKSILISVLTEVKLSAQNQTLVKETIEQKDVKIQKGLSQNDMAYSNTGFLRNMNCDPFRVSPYVANSQMLSNVCYPITCPMRYSQNYPILVPTQPAPLCTGCYKPRFMDSQPFVARRIISTSTNTGDAGKNKRNPETASLIKEIYKSVALGLETPILKRKTATSSLARRPPENTTANKKKENFKTNINEVTSHLVALESKSVTAARVDVTPGGADRPGGRSAEDRAPNLVASDENIEEESDSEESTTESESEEDCDVTVKNTSKSLFKKMISSIFKKKKGVSKHMIETPGNDDVASDSDDYQTIYSQELPPTSARRERMRRPFPYSKRPKKYKYFTSEENRRQWAQKVGERENQSYIERHSYTPLSGVRDGRSAYDKNYETLQALIHYRDKIMRDEMEDGSALWEPKQSRRPSGDVYENSIEKKGEQSRGNWLRRHKLGLKFLPEWKRQLREP